MSEWVSVCYWLTENDHFICFVLRVRVRVSWSVTCGGSHVFNVPPIFHSLTKIHHLRLHTTIFMYATRLKINHSYSFTVKCVFVCVCVSLLFPLLLLGFFFAIDHFGIYYEMVWNGFSNVGGVFMRVCLTHAHQVTVLNIRIMVVRRCFDRFIFLLS